MIPLPLPEERSRFAQWLADNKVSDPFHPDQHYDNVGAFRSGIGRAPGEQGHFPDTFKLPGHPTFSNESQYATGDNAKYAGSWPENAQSDSQYIPPGQKYQQADPQFAKAVLELFNAVASGRR